MSNSWTLPAVPIVPVSPVPSQATQIGQAIDQAPQYNADKAAKLATAKATTADAGATTAEAEARTAAAPALGQQTIADAQTKTMGSNLAGLKQYAEILRATPGAQNSPLIKAALDSRFKALGLTVPMMADGSGIDVAAMEQLASPQPHWSELGADDLKKWENQPSSVRRAKFPDAPEEWLSKAVMQPMTPVEEQSIYHGIDAQIDQVGKGVIKPPAFLASVKSARARLQAAEMSTAGVDQYLNDDGTDLAPSLVDQIVGSKTEEDIQHYRDLGIHMADEDSLRKSLATEHKREFDKNYIIATKKVDLQAQNMARLAQQGAERIQQGWANVQARQQSIGLTGTRLQMEAARNYFQAYDGDFKSLQTQLESNKRAIQSAANLGHPVKPDSDLFTSTAHLQEQINALEPQVNAARNMYVQQPATTVQQISGHPSTVTGGGAPPAPAGSKGIVSRSDAIRIGKKSGLSESAAIKDAESHGYTVQ